MKFKKYNLLIIFFLFNSFIMNNAQAQNYEVINMNKLISEIDNYYKQFQNNEQLLFDFKIMNLNDEELQEFFKSHGNASSLLIEKIKASPQLWEVFDSEPIAGLVNFNDFQFPNDITFDNKKFTITKISDERVVGTRRLSYQLNNNNIFLQIDLTICHVIDDKGNIEYSYKGARNVLLGNFLFISLPIYMEYKIPQNHIGSFSVSERFNIYPKGRYSWVYKNTNVIVDNNGISEELFMEICHWLQQELEKNVTY